MELITIMNIVATCTIGIALIVMQAIVLHDVSARWQRNGIPNITGGLEDMDTQTNSISSGSAASTMARVGSNRFYNPEEFSNDPTMDFPMEKICDGTEWSINTATRHNLRNTRTQVLGRIPHISAQDGIQRNYLLVHPQDDGDGGLANTLRDRSLNKQVCWWKGNTDMLKATMNCDMPGWSYSVAYNYKTGQRVVFSAWGIDQGGMFGVSVEGKMIYTNADSPTSQIVRSNEDKAFCRGDICYFWMAKDLSVIKWRWLAINIMTMENHLTEWTDRETSEECAQTPLSGDTLMIYCRDQSAGFHRTFATFKFDGLNVTETSYGTHCTTQPADTPRGTGLANGCKSARSGNGGLKGNIYYDHERQVYHSSRNVLAGTRKGMETLIYGEITENEVTTPIVGEEVINNLVDISYQSFFTLPGNNQCRRLCLLAEHTYITPGGGKSVDFLSFCYANGRTAKISPTVL